MESLERITSSSRKDFWQDRPTLITGGTGLLGSWLTRFLFDLGADLTLLVRDWVPQSMIIRDGLIERVKSVRGDLRNAELIKRAFAEYEVDTCFHLGAQTIVGIANRLPVPTFETNIMGTWNILEAARLWGKTGRVVVASSDKAYGDHLVLPYDENAPLQGRHPYDVSKSCADLITLTYAQSYGVPAAVTRCGNLYGGGDLNWNRIVPGTMRSLLRGEAPIIRSDGTMRRDYVYVADAVDAYLTLAEHMVDGNLTGEAFNFGLDRPLTVLELVDEIISISPQPEAKPIIKGEASNEIQDQYLSSKKAAEVLGWQPKFSLAEGLSHTFNWYKNHLSS